MSMDGRYFARSQEGGAIMSMDGRYFARSHGGRCDYVHGWTVFRKEPGRRCDYVHGWTVFRKEPWRAVRLCPWMDGLKLLPAFSTLPTSMWVVSAKSQEGGAIMSMDGRVENCSLHFPHFPRPCGRMLQGARKAVRLCTGSTGGKLLPAFSTLPTPMWVVSAKSQEGGAVMSMDGRAENCSCIFRTSHVHVGRMLQGARKAVRLCNVKLTPATLAVLFIASRFTPHNSGRLPRLFNHSSCTGR